VVPAQRQRRRDDQLPPARQVLEVVIPAANPPLSQMITVAKYPNDPPPGSENTSRLTNETALNCGFI
jgi:hypothetical protein